MNKAQQDIRRKKRVLEHAARIGNVRKTCRYFGVARSGFYVWKKAYETQGDEGLVNQKPCPYNPRLRTPPTGCSFRQMAALVRGNKCSSRPWPS